MPSTLHPLSRILPFALTLLSTIPAAAQLADRVNRAHPVDLGVHFTYLHTNLLPGCNCFSVSGGGAEVQIALTPHFAAVGDFNGVTRSGITQDNYTLTLVTYTGGLRFSPTHPHARIHPFGEVLIGAAHASGSLAPSNNAIHGNANSIDFQAGGGVFIRLTKRIQVMPAQFDYVLTTFENHANDQQNNLRFSAGLTFRLHR